MIYRANQKNPSLDSSLWQKKLIKLFARIHQTTQRVFTVRSLPMIVAVSICAITVVLSHTLLTNDRHSIEKAINLEVTNTKILIAHEVQEQISGLVNMAKQWEKSGKPSKEIWEAQAAFYLESCKSCQAIQWVDPSFNVSWSLPVVGDRTEQNFNLELKQQIAQAIATKERKVIVSHSINLKQGGKGFLVYVPIVREDKFAGFIVGVFRFKELFNILFNSLKLSSEVTYALSIYDRSETIYSSISDRNLAANSWSKTNRIQLYNIAWQIQVFPLQNSLIQKQSPLPIVILFGGFLMAGLVAWTVYLTQLSRRRAQTFERVNQRLGKEISQRQRVEERLKETTRLQRAILDSANYTIISTDVNGTILTFNPTAERLLRYNASEVIGKTTPLLFHNFKEISKHAEDLSQELGVMIEPGFEVFVTRSLLGKIEESEWTYITKNITDTPQISIPSDITNFLENDNRSYFPVLLSVTALRDLEANITGFLFIGSDITQRKQAEASLQRQRELLEVTLASIGDAVIATDKLANITFINPWAEVLTGWSAQEALGRQIDQVFCMIDERSRQEVQSPVQQVLQTKVAFELSDRTLLRPRSGQEIPIDQNCTPIFRNTGSLYGAVLVFRNTTVRRQAENALREAEAKYRNIFENAVEGIFQTTFDGQFINVNPALIAIYGYESAADIIQNITNIKTQVYVDPNRRDEFASLMQQHDALFRFESQIYRQDGTKIWISENARIVRDSEGQPLYYEGSVEDISQRKQVEAALLESQERWQLAVRGNNDGIWDWNVKTNQTFFSPRWKQMIGYEDHEIANHFSEWEKRIHPEDVPRTMQTVKEHFTQQTPFYIVEHRILCKDGTYKWILARGQAIWDEAGNPVRMTGSHTDITLAKQAESALKESEEWFRNLVETSSDWVWEVDANDFYTYASPKVRELLGYEPEELLGKTPFDLMPPEELARVANFFYAIAAAQEPFNCVENTNIHKDGHLVVLESSGVPIFNADGTFRGYRGMDRDITDRKRSDFQLRASLKEKEVLLKEIHHRVKNNLQVISSLLKLQAGYIDDENVQSLFTESYNRVRSMALIHEKLYQTSNLAKIDAADYIRNLVDNLFRSYNISTQKIDLCLKVDKILLDVDTAVPCGLIINEIVSNALKYAFNNQKCGEISIHFIKKDRDYLLLSIKDNGKGLPPDFNLEESESLGLQLVVNLTEQLEGTLNYGSNGGTCFKILFKPTIRGDTKSW
ncbi:MAG: PAS domain S-box protein [Microcoleus anatoxicus]|uniref:PAS domain S-box protein n=1 Tax=Microcoleus anatoxicus TaxID=2705319 RepID=UPI00366E29BC